jgi:uncharacterized protein YndB with AHSA1/START domain
VKSRAIRLEEIVEAPAKEVWAAWTTVPGLRTFLAPDARIEVKAGGRWEIFFEAAPEGARGSEGCRVLEVVRGRMLAFEWNFPPSIPAIRHEKTRVTVEFNALGEGQTLVALEQTGWHDGKAWDEGFEYFASAWGVVLARLERSFREGPLDWANPWRPGQD